MSVRVQESDFDVTDEVERLTAGDTGIGAVATFIGKVRGLADGAPLSAMTLEHYPGMTQDELGAIEQEAVTRFALSASVIVHRIGTLKPGDNIVLVVTCAPHRANAFDACAFLMDYLKARAPFWKKEIGPDGSGRWVEARDCDAPGASHWQE